MSVPFLNEYADAGVQECPSTTRAKPHRSLALVDGIGLSLVVHIRLEWVHPHPSTIEGNPSPPADRFKGVFGGNRMEEGFSFIEVNVPERE